MAGTVTRERARARPGARIPLSSAQERLWFIDHLTPRQAGYNNFIVRRFRGRLEPDVLERAFTEIVRRHDTLRTTFATVAGTPVGRLAEPFPVPLRVVEAGDEDEVRRLAAAEIRTPFDLATGPLVRTSLYRLAPDDQVLLVTVHHIVADGWSLGVLYDELTALYDAFVRGLPSPLPEPLQYVEYVEWQRERLGTEVQEAALDYWCGRLADAATLELPTDRPRPPLQTYTGAAHLLTLRRDLAARVAEVARAARATPYMVYLAAYVALLSRYARQDDVVVGTAVAARLRPEFERMIGFFANTCAIRVDAAGDPSFCDLVGRVRTTVFEALQHQDAPFEEIVRRLNVPRDPSRNPIFQALFGLLNTPPPLVDLPGLTQLDFELDAGTTRFDLELLVYGNDDRLRAHVVYNTDLFDAGTVERMAESLLVLLDAAVGDPGLRLSQLPLLTPLERWRVLAGLKGEAAPPAAATVHELVERRAAADPDAPAVRFGDAVLTYGEVVARSRRLAARLREVGVTADRPVGVCVERSPDLVVALLSVLQAGGAYTALDPRYPRERLEFVLADSGAAAVVTQAHLRDRLPAGAPPTVVVDGDVAGPTGARHVLGTGTLAYVIYTSGSTGTPKGVAMPHRPLVGLVGWHLDHPRLGRPAVTLQLAAASFDVAFQEIFTTLATGGTLVLLDEDEARDPAAIWDTIVANGVERLFATPTALELVARRAAAAGRAPLRDVVASGEPFRVSPAVEALVDRTGAVLHNQYGPSETHVVTSGPVAAGDAAPPIGQPLPNVELYVLDATLSPVPVGVPGELFVGGPVVSRGYVARPALTAERYLPDPFSGQPGARLYRTGDVVRCRADGELEFVERADTQVKVRGFRIELGEVEARLAAHPAVVAAAAAVHGDGPSKRLVAYVVGDEATLDPAALRSFLAERLPEHMLPGAYVVLPALPLTRTGKLDRAALPAPPLERDALAPQYVEPATPTERRLAAIWTEVLELDRVGAEDDFFALGGDSFRASRVAAHAGTADAPLPVRALFEHTTVRALARRLDEVAAGGEDAAGDDVPGELSPVERRFFFAAQVDEATPQTTGFALRLRGALDVEALRRAIRALVARHPALRSGFELVEGEPRRRVLPAETQMEVEVVDVAREDEASVLADIFLRPFDLSKPPLLRPRILRLADDEHVLAFPIHHIVTDGWSNAILVDELATLYRGEPLSPPADYGAFVAWQRERVAGPEGERQRAYWRRRLAGLEPLALPFDRRPPAVPSFRAARLRFALDPALVERLAALAQDARATPFMVYTAALWEVLRAVTGQKDVAFATPTGGRPRPEFERAVGPFVNTLVLRSERREPTFGALLAAARQTVLDAFEHQDLPFDDVVADQEAERRPGRNPLAQVMLSLQNQPPVAPDFGDLDVEPVDVDAGASVFDLVVRCHGPEIELVYRTDFFDEATAQALRRRFVTTLETASSDATPEERRFLAACNATARSVAAEPTLHELVAAQVERTPTAPAVSFAGGTLSYAELHERATALAGALQAAGAGPERRVAVRLERSLDLPVALLAVLHAGAACVPIDPGYPAARGREMLAAARPVAVVATEPVEGVPVVPPDARAPFAPVAVDPAMLAFVLFTSGSTGKPKAVALPHAGLVNRIACGRERDRLGPGERVLHKASISFDVALHEIFTPLASGALLELAEPGLHADPAYLVELVRRRELTCIHFVPSLLRHVVAEPGLEECRSLRRVLCGGEALPPDLAARLLKRLPHVDLHNQYGPTEASVSVAFRRVGLGDLERPRVPVGTPIANTQLHVVDERLAPLPVGVVGELAIGGVAVARGYLGDPAATAERFVPDPFGPPGARLYRTGDCARRPPDGAVEVLGRLDDQVKVRGNRVELAEVEAALRACPGVAEAAVAVEGDELVAAVVGAVSTDALRERLPAFMVPTRIAAVDEVPRLPSGKVDRAALRRLARAERAAPIAHAADGTAAELLEIWRRVLGRDDVGLDDPFFSVGGHSLLVLRVVAAARERGLPLTARLMLEHQTVAAVAAALDAPSSAAGRFVRLNDRPGPPLVLFHPGGGGVGSYRPLAERTARLVLGVEAPPELPASLHELAAAYAAELRASLPAPPMLGGWSFGAAVAFVTARALAAAGHEVARVVLVEPPLLDGTTRESALEPLRALRERALAAGDGTGYRAALEAAGLGDPGEAWAAFPLDTWLALETAARGHRLGRYDGAVDLVVSDACVDRDDDYYATHAFGASFADYRNRWRSLARDVVVHQLPGDHFSLVDADVAGLAAVVARL